MIITIMATDVDRALDPMVLNLRMVLMVPAVLLRRQARVGSHARLLPQARAGVRTGLTARRPGVDAAGSRRRRM